MVKEELEKYVGKRVEIHLMCISDKEVDYNKCKPYFGTLRHEIGGSNSNWFYCETENGVNPVFTSAYVHDIRESENYFFDDKNEYKAVLTCSDIKPNKKKHVIKIPEMKFLHEIKVKMTENHEVINEINLNSLHLAQDKLRCIYYSEGNEQSKYSIEPHGEDGQYALYYGRDYQHHGERLCNLYDFDVNKDKVIIDICDALNKYKGTK